VDTQAVEELPANVELRVRINIEELYRETLRTDGVPVSLITRESYIYSIPQRNGDEQLKGSSCVRNH